jgi:hypothetical protein
LRLSCSSRNWRSTCGITHHFWWLSPAPGQIAHVFLTRPPRDRPKAAPFDLHALGTPPALILSQDQTLHQNHCVRTRRPVLRRPGSVRVVPLLVSLPVDLGGGHAPPSRAQFLCIDVVVCSRCATESNSRPDPMPLLPLQRTTPSPRAVARPTFGPCSTLTCQGAWVNPASSAIFTRRIGGDR